MKFKTDSAGIEHVLKVLDLSEKTNDPHVDKAIVQVHSHAFPVIAGWEKQAGVTLFNPETIKSGRLFERVGVSEGCAVFIDDEQATVYVQVTTY